MQIDDLPPLRDVILKYNLEAKKSLGQNFLHDLNLTSKIALLSGSIKNSTILEIGAGSGRTTETIISLLDQDKKIKYVIVDIPPAIYINFLRMKNNYPNKKLPYGVRTRVLWF